MIIQKLRGHKRERAEGNSHSLGILIIGSLYWDVKEDRPSWRKSRLRMKEQFRVKAPIRYGRKSGNRSDTYTMVFSSLCRQGKARVVRCKKPVSSSRDLIDEAVHLWTAEGGNKDGSPRSVGEVGLRRSAC